ncbi:pseudouridylate synthase [Dyadobacter frigoris]|uniref:pseudouridylate synthase n=1 Tax=Dyadobacter frigoris TaxID=2576211 RepID=UPI001E65539A|nr:pseudouridylate synthase [Dyadobacter frigoris]
MIKSISSADKIFSPFEESLAAYTFPYKFTFPFDYEPHPLSLLAVEKLQSHLENQQEWDHNFGLKADQEGTVIGKMFGVLVVRTEDDEIGYLSAFSGKLAGGNHHQKFVPPIFDGMADGGFLNTGMEKLSLINQQIKALEDKETETQQEVELLKTTRKAHSVSLQKEIFDQYNFLNQKGDKKSLCEIFEDASYKNPPAGAGECAAPKLLQYAFQQNMQPIAIAEFWWGLSPKSDFRKHGHFYPACREKCEPILGHMLGGIEMDEQPF